MNHPDYIKFLESFADIKAPLKIVADASNGSAGPILKKLKIKGIKIIILAGNPNGEFPAHGPDPTGAFASRDLAEKVKKEKADLGAIFDGDADRVFFIDELGRRVKPDAAALLMTRKFKPPYVATSTVGWTFKKSLKKNEIVISRAGHTNIKAKMRQVRAKFGAEISGHYYFEFDFKTHKAYYDSALRALVELASAVSALKKEKQTFSGWLGTLPLYINSGEINFKVKSVNAILNKTKLAYSKRCKISTLDGVTAEGSDFWFNLRPSHTESLLRLNLEAEKKQVFKCEMAHIRKIIMG